MGPTKLHQSGLALEILGRARNISRLVYIDGLLETCEVLLNLDSDGIARLMAADKFEKNLKHLNQIFGDTEWPSEIAGQRSSMQQLCAAVLMAYKRSLRALASPLCVRLCDE